MSDLFDDNEGALRKRAGMNYAAGKRHSDLEIARNVALKISQKKRYVTADDVGRVLQREYGILSLGPAAGSLFRTKDWRFTGLWKQSKRVKNHSRMLRVWERAND